MEEVWKSIEGYDDIYQISNLGRVRSKYLNRYVSNTYKDIKPLINNRGYYYIGCRRKNVRTNFLIHRLIATYFIPKINGYDLIDHIDKNKLNNDVSNLRWVDFNLNNQNKNVNKNNKLGQKHISMYGNRFKVQITKNRIVHIKNGFKSLEDAIIYRDEYLLDA